MRIIDAISLGLDVHSISGYEAKCVCPFHDDHRPSANFNVLKGQFYCFACGASSNARNLALILGGRIVYTTVALLSKIKEAKDSSWKSILLWPLAYDNKYLKSRQVTNEQVRKFDIRESYRGVVFPIRDKNGTSIGAIERRYSDLPKYFIYGSKSAIWPLNHLTSRHRLFLVEGPFSVLRADRAGINAYAVMGATALKQAIEYTNGMDRVSALDPDFAGVLGTVKLMFASLPSVYPLFYPDEVSIGYWREYLNSALITRNYNDILKQTDNPEKILRLARKWSSYAKSKTYQGKNKRASQAYNRQSRGYKNRVQMVPG